MAERSNQRVSRESGTLPLHVRIRQELLERIEKGVYREGQMIPSEHDLCDDFGVSRITIRQAMGSLTQEGYLERFPGRGTFVKARSVVKTPRSRVLTLVLANAIGSFMAEVVRGVDSTAKAAGYDLHLSISYDRLEEESRLLREILEKKPAGALVFTCDTEGSANPNCMDYLRIREAGIPLLFVDRYLSSLPIGYIVAADEAGMRTLTQHIIDQGHTRIGYMDHAVEVTSVIARRAGFLAALMDNRLHPECIVRVDRPRDGGDDTSLAYAAMKSFLASGKPLPTAMIGCNTYYAIGMFRALKEAGIRVPEDVVLAGIDDIPEAAVLEVPMTVFRAPVEEMGRVAAQRLISLIETGGTGEDVRVMLPGTLIVRDSCGARGSPATPV